MDRSPTRIPGSLSRAAARFLIAGVLLAAAAFSAGAEPQRITRDGSGVLHWEDGSEVRLWGVTYLAPFSGSFANLGRLRRDIHEVIDRDLDDIRGLEANLVHVLVFDREITDPEGNLLDNPHLEALDYLVAACRERDMYVSLTAVTWLESDGDSTDGFSDHWFRDELIRLREAWPPQENYLRQLAGHVNPHTGLSYAADPTVAAWNILHEPQATGMTKNRIPLDQASAYAARMLGVLREAGVLAPVLYSTHGYRFDRPDYGELMLKSGVDGWVFEVPIGGITGSELHIDYLGPQSWAAWLLRRPIEWLWGDQFVPTLSYRFHGCIKNYMYAPLARSLVASRVQIATLFQYDARPLAGHNTGYRAVWFNRDYTPAAGLGFRIGARLFREIPLGEPVAEDLPQDNWDFDGVRASDWLDVATMERDGVFLFTKRPPYEIPGTLEDYRLLAGADSTNLVEFEGVRWFTSAFDAADGRLDLELGPVVRRLADNPFETGKWYLNIRFCREVAALDAEPAWVRLNLADDSVAVYRNDGGTWTPVPVDGLRFDAVPGSYRVYLDASR